MKIKSFIFALIAATVLFAACDVIPENDRLGKVEKEESGRRVLLMEFTGWRCVNCPEAAKIAHDLLASIPNNLVVVAMHPTGHGFTTPENTANALSTTEAMDYLTAYGGSGATGFPIGVVNGVKFGTDYLQGRDKWTSLILDEIKKAPVYSIDLSYTKTSQHQVVAKVTPIDTTANSNVSLQMWLLESNIVAPQIGGGNTYVHNHVFRKGLNALWGDELGNVTAEMEKTYSFDVESRYVVDNCSVVAVLIDTETKEVLQVAEVALGNGAH